MSTRIREGLTAEHAMLAVLLAVSAVFLAVPIIEDYPRDARVFPQMMAAVVFVGSFLLVIQNYLPGPVRTFVAEDMSVTSTDDIVGETSDTDGEDAASGDETMAEDESGGEDVKEDQHGEMSPRLGEEYGIEVNDTLFMVATATAYLVAGWAAGFLFVTLPFVFLYMVWFRIPWTVALASAVFATVVIWFFMTFLILPFDQGAIFDLSPLLPFVIESTIASAPWETALPGRRVI